MATKKWYLFNVVGGKPTYFYLTHSSEAPNEKTHDYCCKTWFGPFSTAKDAVNAVRMLDHYMGDVMVYSVPK